MDQVALLTVEEVARSTRLSRTVVYGLIRSGALPSLLIGRSRRITPQALTDFVAAVGSATATRAGRGYA